VPLIQKEHIIYLILISDSIMVPCYGSKSPNTKGCVILVLLSVESVMIFLLVPYYVKPVKKDKALMHLQRGH